MLKKLVFNMLRKKAMLSNVDLLVLVLVCLSVAN
jgi:hypothetical protein